MIIEIDAARCKRCGICREFCPLEVFGQELDGLPVVVNEENCNRCSICILRCPDFALSFGGD